MSIVAMGYHLMEHVYDVLIMASLGMLQLALIIVHDLKQIIVRILA